VSTKSSTSPRGRISSGALVCLVAAELLVGCQDERRGPEYAPSVEQSAYAEGYPETVDLLTEQVVKEREAVTQFQNGLTTLPEQLTDPDWSLVGEVYAAADEEGRTRAYSERHAELLLVRRFFEDNKKTIVSRVAGGAQHQAKEKECDVELYGPVSFSFDRALETSVQERRRAGSPAQRLIDENEERLGKKNLEPLAGQADQLALASHVVHIRLLTDQQELARLVDEADAVRATLDQRIKELESADKPDKDALSRAVTARNEISERVEKARIELERSEERNKKLKDDYEAAFARLQDAVQVLAGRTSSE